MTDTERREQHNGPAQLAAQVDHPPHYTFATGFEPIDVIEAWGLGFHLGNAVKYVARAGRKGDALVDLHKARWYLDRAIARAEAPDVTPEPSSASMACRSPTAMTTGSAQTLVFDLAELRAAVSGKESSGG